MLRRIALDMHLIRDYAAPLASLAGVPGDLRGTADAWGEGEPMWQCRPKGGSSGGGSGVSGGGGGGGDG